jgi:molybdopterin/thiamine biosynthesis adenylyltransferase
MFEEQERFIKNLVTISPQEQKQLAAKSVFISGCGGLGGFVGEYLTRLGLGSLVFCDFDKFELDNMNRQLLCIGETLGKNKAMTATERSLAINPSIKARAVTQKLTKDNADSIISGCDLVVDALDNIADRIMLENAAQKNGVPLISAAVKGYMGQVVVSLPGDFTVFKLYDNYTERKEVGTLSLVAGITAGYAATEAIKLLSGDNSGSKRVLIIDTFNRRLETITLK